jgi:sugar lactone lactonase YvrE
MKSTIPSFKFTLIGVVRVLAIAAVGLIPKGAYAAPGDLSASVNGTNQNGGGSIFQYAPDGTQTTFAFGLSRPRGVLFDNAGNLFAATTARDGSGNFQGTIFKITPGGMMSTLATFGPNFFLEGLVMDSAGNVFVMADNFSDPNLASTIFKVTPGGAVGTFGSVPSLGFGLTFDSGGNLFAADAFDLTVYKFTPEGIRSIFAGPTAFSGVGNPNDLVFDNFGNLFVSTNSGNFSNDTIVKVTSESTGTIFATGLRNPRGLAFDSTGNLFVAEVPIGAGAIRKFNSNGTEVLPTFASGVGSALTNQAGGPEFLAFPPNTLASATAMTVNIGTVGSAVVAVTFPQVIVGGTTIAIPIDPSSAGTLPFGYELAGGNVAFEISTAATYVTPPTIIIAFQLPLVDAATFAQFRVLHNEGGTLVDRTASGPFAPNPTTQTIFASVSSLSPFVIARLAVPTNKNECKNGGWQTHVRVNGSRFKNQGDCIQYVNSGK